MSEEVEEGGEGGVDARECSDIHHPRTPAMQTMRITTRLKSVAWSRVVGFWDGLRGVEESIRGTAGERCSTEMPLARRSGPGGCKRPVVSEASPRSAGEAGLVIGEGMSSVQVKPL